MNELDKITKKVRALRRRAETDKEFAKKLESYEDKYDDEEKNGKG